MDPPRAPPEKIFFGNTVFPPKMIKITMWGPSVKKIFGSPEIFLEVTRPSGLSSGLTPVGSGVGLLGEPWAHPLGEPWAHF